MRFRLRFRVIALALAAGLGGLAGSGGAAAALPVDHQPYRRAVRPVFPRWTPPPANAGLDYQLATAYALPAGVKVVTRDVSMSAAAGAYSICYVNGFQAQPDALDWWEANHPELLLRRNGTVVMDEDWGEAFLDPTTAAKRSALAAVVAGWLDTCVAHGFRAVEVDNLDSWTRSGGLIAKADTVAYATLLARAAHARGLAIGQKNALDLGAAGRRTVGFDFAVAEDCADYELSPGVPECQGYVDVYGSQVYVIEYDDAHYAAACERFGARVSIVRRDRDVSAPGSPTYVFATC